MADASADYAETLERIQRAQAMLERLRDEPPTPKGDFAIALLQEHLGRAIMAMRGLGP